MILHVVTSYILCGNDSNYGRNDAYMWKRVDDCMRKCAMFYDLSVETDAKPKPMSNIII